MGVSDIKNKWTKGYPLGATGKQSHPDPFNNCWQAFWAPVWVNP